MNDFLLRNVTSLVPGLKEENLNLRIKGPARVTRLSTGTTAVRLEEVEA